MATIAHTRAKALFAQSKNIKTATLALEVEAKADKALAAELTADALHKACVAAINRAAMDMRKIGFGEALAAVSTPPAPNGSNVAAMVGASLLDTFIIAGGKSVGDATPSEARVSMERYMKAADTSTLKALFLGKMINSAANPDQPFRTQLSAEATMKLFQEAHEEV